VADGVQSQDTVHSPKKVLELAVAEAVTRLPSWRPRFNLRPVPAGFLVGRVPMGQVFL
jgi:hypothetical protein